MIKKMVSGKSIFANKTIFTFDSEALKYLLIKNKKLKSKKDIQDIEKYEFQKLYIGNIYSEKENYYFYSLQNFLRIINDLKDKYKNLMLIAHNLKYDLKLIGLLDLFIKENMFLGMNCEIKMFGNVNYFKFAIKENNKTINQIEFLDTFNYIKKSLKDISEKMFPDMHKFASNEDYELEFDKWNNYIKKNGKELVIQDCKILYELTKFLQNYDKIIYGMSNAQSSYKTWNIKFNPTKIIDLDFMNLIIPELYHGGRTEVYLKDVMDNYISLDINSLYPYVMKKYKYSIKYRGKLKINNQEDIDYLLEQIKEQNYNYVMLIHYKTELKRTPIMNKVNNTLVDLKENLTWITGQEFLSLYENDKNLSFKIYNCLEFINADLFSKYIDYFYNIKKNAKNEIEKEFAKLMQNGLYGKFAQKNKHLVLESYDTLKEIEVFKNDNDRINFNGIEYSLYENFYTYNEEENYKFAPLISAEITANSRIENYKYQILFGLENIKMTDTDSFFIPLSVFEKYDKEFLDKIINNELGNLKIEWDKSGNIKFYGLKDYENFTLNIRKTKGIKKNAKQSKDENGNIIKNQYEMQVFKILNKEKNVGVVIEKRIKNLNYKYTKMKYNDEGIGIIFENVEEYYKYNKINMPEWYNCKCNTVKKK